MLIAKEHRERLNHYCMVRKVTQEVAVNEMVAEGLQRIDQDPVMKQRIDRAKELQEAMDNL
jgi:hypothetical protein